MKRESETMGGSSQGPWCVWQGLTVSGFFRLLALRPPFHWRKTLRWMLVTVSAFYNSLMKLIERAVWGRRIARLELQPPVFILGHWRSGTTLLHYLMSRDPQFTYCNLYQIIGCPHFLITEGFVTRLTGRWLPRTRPMDNVPVTWDSPQEDESALCLMTMLSPYLMLTFNNQRQVYERYFDLLDLTPSEWQRWKTAFIDYLKRLCVRTGRRALLKSPTHTYRIRRLLEIFPEAKFVYIHRNPYEVYTSTMHLRRKLFEANTLGKYTEDGMEADLMQTYEHLIRRYEEDKKLLRLDQLYEVRFEDLERDPVAQLEAIYRQLQMPGIEALKKILEPELAGLKEYKKNAYKPMDEALKRRIYDRFRQAFDAYGYPSGLAEEAATRPAAAAAPAAVN